MGHLMRWISLLVLAACSAARAVALDAAPAPSSVPAPLSAEQIVEKNAVARGGLEAWRKVQSMAWSGHMESAGVPVQNMPFLLEQKRPNKTRFEMTAMSQKSLRVFDGAHGWKVRPAKDGRPDVKPYSPQEVKFAREEPVIDGPLIDCQAKGILVTLDGVDEVEGHKAYRLDVRLANGDHQTVWIDAQTFLDLKYDRTSYNAAGKPGTVTVFYRDYRRIEGLQIPTTLEIGAGSAKIPDKMVIERVALNPTLDDRMFGRPGLPRRRNMVTVDVDPESAVPVMPVAPSAPAAKIPDPGSTPK